MSKQCGSFIGGGAGLQSEVDYARSKKAEDQHGPRNRPLSEEGIRLALAQWDLGP